MAELIVSVEKVQKVEKHPYADRLDIVTVKGWQVIVRRYTLEDWDSVLYIPIDSILPKDLEEFIFPPESKIKLKNSKIRTIKIRKIISQGLVVPVSTFFATKWENIIFSVSEGIDIKKKLGITKWEPPKSNKPSSMKGQQRSKKQTNPYFRKYTSINHLKNYPDVLEKETQNVVITEKIHGTNFRAGYVPSVADTLFKKIKKLFRRLPKYEFVFGSHNVQLQNKMLNNTYYKNNVYAYIVKKYDLKNLLKLGEVIYGEIYGDGIQAGYTYGLKNEIDLAVFDVMEHGVYIDFLDIIDFCSHRRLEIVPIIGNCKYSIENLEKYLSGPSLNLKQKIKEGIVVRTLKEKQTHAGRSIFKFLNPEYLLKKGNTEFH